MTTPYCYMFIDHRLEMIRWYGWWSETTTRTKESSIYKKYERNGTTWETFFPFQINSRRYLATPWWITWYATSTNCEPLPPIQRWTSATYTTTIWKDKYMFVNFTYISLFHCFTFIMILMLLPLVTVYLESPPANLFNHRSIKFLEIFPESDLHM